MTSLRLDAREVTVGAGVEVVVVTDVLEAVVEEGVEAAGQAEWAEEVEGEAVEEADHWVMKHFTCMINLKPL